MHDFLSVPGPFGMLCFKKLKKTLPPFQNKFKYTLQYIHQVEKEKLFVPQNYTLELYLSCSMLYCQNVNMKVQHSKQGSDRFHVKKYNCIIIYLLYKHKLNNRLTPRT